MTHDYKRHGTTTLFAALSALDSTVIGRCIQRHRHLEFIRFPQCCQGPSRGQWADPCRPRQRCHPQASQSAGLAGVSSALDLPLHADLGLLAQRRREALLQNDPAPLPPRASSARSPTCNAYLAEHNASPKPFVCTKSAEAILAKLDHCPVPPFDSVH
jgi:hypothetical protein